MCSTDDGHSEGGYNDPQEKECPLWQNKDVTVRISNYRQLSW